MAQQEAEEEQAQNGGAPKKKKLSLYFHEHLQRREGHMDVSFMTPIYAASAEEAWEQARRWAQEGMLILGEEDIMHHFPRGFLVCRARLPGVVEVDA